MILVGRLTKKPELKVTESNKQMSYISLAVPRSFKNINGEYETDFFDCTLWDRIALNATEYCDKGDVIAIRGRVQSRILELEDGSKRKQIDIIVEKITFLTSKKNEKAEEISVAAEDIVAECVD